jgi:hypothetical protein
LATTSGLVRLIFNAKSPTTAWELSVCQVDRGGIEHPPKSSENLRDFQPSGAESGALKADSVTLADPDLALIVDTWPTLPADVKAAILALINTGTGG